jgi:glucose/arabinose dehydrogenase
MKRNYPFRFGFARNATSPLFRGTQIATVIGLFGAWLVLSLAGLQAANLPDGFAETRIATGLDPSDMTFAPDGRLFLTEKVGRVRIVKEGALLTTPFLTLPNVENDNEQGLLGIAFDPDFTTNHYVYVYYTARTPAVHNRVSRFTANGDVVMSGSETIILELEDREAGIHNGGSVFFRDGYLFVTTGETSVPDYAQSLQNRLGKVLRINADGSIPTDNPFYTTATGANRAIWALGLRNPFKAAVQPGTGRIFINDVGQSSWEEINEGLPGANYGWPGIEGRRPNQTPSSGYQDPVYAYSQFDDNGCAITGGAFYNPTTSQFPSSYIGLYFFSDYCGDLRTLNPSNGTVTGFATAIGPIDIAVAPDGSLYYLARGSSNDNTSSGDGELWRVQYTNSNAPSIAAEPSSQTASLGTTAVFTVIASGSALSYQWQRDGIDIAGATGATYALSNVHLSDNGARFNVVVTNSISSVTSNDAILTVINNQVPTADITAPAASDLDNAPRASDLYRAGDVIRFSGTGTDPEDGDLPATSYRWLVNFHHETHLHPGPSVTLATDGKSGSFEIPTEGENSADVWYRLFLIVTDSQGATHKDSIDIYPRVVTVRLASDPTGLSLNLDGQPRTTPYDQQFVSGMVISLAAPSSQTSDGLSYTFESWSGGTVDNGSITIPDENTTYTANFIEGGAQAREADNPTNVVAGLIYQYYEGSWEYLPDFSSLLAVETGTVTDVDLTPRNRDYDFGFQFKGYIDVPTDGAYTFYTSSDDGSKLYIGSSLVVDNDGLHGVQEGSGTISLKAGKHAITIDFFEQFGGDSLSVSYAGPGIAKQLVPTSAWFRESDVFLTQVLEAEHATYSGVQISTDRSGYSGTGFADYINLTGDYVEWNVNVPTAGTYNLGFRYSLGSVDDRPLEIKVNDDVVHAELSFPSTTTWSNWSFVNTWVNLNAGDNTVRATAIGSSGANVDRLEVSAVADADARIAQNERIAESFVVRYYPVPVSDVLTIETDTALEGAIRIIDTKGLLIKSVATQPKQTRAELSVAGLPAGLYLVAIPVNGRIIVKKIAVQH